MRYMMLGDVEMLLSLRRLTEEHEEFELRRLVLGELVNGRSGLL